MIQKGIIEALVSPYEYKVRIPRYDKLVTTPDGVKTEDLSSAIVCSTPGTKISFVEGDIVLIGFENNELNKPVILGSLYRQEIGEHDQFNLPVLESALKVIQSEIDVINNSNLYAHIKYSNDNGVTFTSLYEYTDTYNSVTSQNSYVAADNIKINPTSSSIYWSVIDSNNVDVTSKFVITTTISATIIENDKEKVITESFTDPLIQIPLRFKHLDSLTLSFRILRIKDFDDYHIVLTTDKDTIGSVYGDYMGIEVTTNPIPSSEPNDYSWTSFYDSIYYLVEKLSSSLLPRVERNEKALYGFTYSDSTLETDDTGILDAMRVTEDTVYLHGASNKNVVFNVNGTVFVDNEHDNFTLKDLDHTNSEADTVFSDVYNDKGHLSLSVRKKVH